MIWERVLPEVSPAGDCGGDIQASDAWSARWRRQLPDGLWAVVTRQFYVADAADEPPFMEVQTEYLACTNPDDPGSTEISANAEYDAVQGYRLDSLGARQAAREAEAPDDYEWAAYAPSWLRAVA